MDRKSWVRGKIKDIKDEKYFIEYCEDEEKILPLNEYNIYGKNTKTTDWDWRTKLKKYDVIDCFDRNKWYPSTIINVFEEENNGFKKIKYHVGFRLYTEHFKNPENENDTYDKHIDLWKNNFSETDIKNDNENEKYVGDMENFDETIIFYSKRIQKFNTFSACQQKNINYSFSPSYYANNEDEKNPMKLMNDKLVNDIDFSIDDFYYSEVEGKKNYIIGKNKNFSYYYAVLLKSMEKDNCFSEFMEILKDKPSTEEIYNIFFILTYCFPYLHRDYFIENSNIIKNSLNPYFMFR